MPDSYADYDEKDYEIFNYEVDENFNVGSTIKFSKVCSGDWYRPGLAFNSGNNHSLPCEEILIFFSSACEWTLEKILATSIPGKDFHISILNCPQCGCTPGENDALTMMERENGITPNQK